MTLLWSATKTMLGWYCEEGGLPAPRKNENTQRNNVEIKNKREKKTRQGCDCCEFEHYFRNMFSVTNPLRDFFLVWTQRLFPGIIQTISNFNQATHMSCITTNMSECRICAIIHRVTIAASWFYRWFFGWRKGFKMLHKTSALFCAYCHSENQWLCLVWGGWKWQKELKHCVWMLMTMTVLPGVDVAAKTERSTMFPKTCETCDRAPPQL